MTADQGTHSASATIPAAQTNGNHTAPMAETTEEPWSVESVLSTLPARYPEHTNSPTPFFHLLERLKTTKRAGWLRFGINGGESISDHMYRMSILTMMAPSSLSSRLNIPRCTKMALIHDMAEALVGDITPVDPVKKEEKSRRESETMDYICNTLLAKWNGGMNGKELREIWQEYEDSQTLESKFVHDIDKMELVLQMVEYERANEGKIQLSEFTHVVPRIKLPEIKEWAQEVMNERMELWRQYGQEAKWADNTKPASS
jgi:putative hydrolase of HD superfamily